VADKDPLILDFGDDGALEGAELDEYYVSGLDDESAYWDDIDLEAISRVDHPDAEAVLAMIGKHASDKATAKAARRAAYKASTRRATRR
jgi:hypothetical protein